MQQAAVAAATAATARCSLRWTHDVTCAFPGPNSYALLFFLTTKGFWILFCWPDGLLMVMAMVTVMM